MSVTRKHLVRKLPRDYFGDCQLSHFGAGRSSDSANNNTSTGHAADSATVPAPSIPKLGSFGVCSTEWFAAGDAMPSAVAGNEFRERAEVPSAGNHRSFRPALDTQQLHDARVISGRAQG